MRREHCRQNLNQGRQVNRLIKSTILFNVIDIPVFYIKGVNAYISILPKEEMVFGNSVSRKTLFLLFYFLRKSSSEARASLIHGDPP